MYILMKIDETSDHPHDEPVAVSADRKALLTRLREEAEKLGGMAFRNGDDSYQVLDDGDELGFLYLEKVEVI